MMKVLLLADPHGPGDEGARNVSKQIYSLLQSHCEVLCIPAPEAMKRLREIRRFRPEIIHALHGPSVKTFYLVALLRRFCGKPACFISLTQPRVALLKNQRPFWRRFGFIHLLSQDPVSERYFTGLGFRVTPVPNGVDLGRFKPVTPAIPPGLNGKIPVDSRVVVHLGHIKKSRGLETLAEVGRVDGWHAVMIGSTRYPAEPEVQDMLERAGVTVLKEFIEDLPGLYSWADAYLFPVSALDGSIDTPLTVLEALASGCEVISTPFKALPRFVPEGTGIHYLRSSTEVASCLGRIGMADPAQIRALVSMYSWETIVADILRLYMGALSDSCLSQPTSLC